MSRAVQQTLPSYGSTRAIGTLLLGLLFLFPLSVTAAEFTAKTPEGAVYDTRTHYYEPILQKVLPKEEYKGISAEEKKAAYSKLGIQLGPRNLEKWLAAQEKWQQTVTERLTRAVKLSAQRRKYLASRPRPLHYSYYYAPVNYTAYYTPMTYFDYWCNVRGFPITNYPHSHSAHLCGWLNCGH